MDGHGKLKYGLFFIEAHCTYNICTICTTFKLYTKNNIKNYFLDGNVFGRKMTRAECHNQMTMNLHNPRLGRYQNEMSDINRYM